MFYLDKETRIIKFTQNQKIPKTKTKKKTHQKKTYNEFFLRAFANPS